MPAERTRWWVVAVRGAVVLILWGAFWALPGGSRDWPVAVVGVIAPVVLAKSLGAERRGKAMSDGTVVWRRGLGVGEPAGVWAGLAAFCAVVPHVDLPYRPDVLYPVIAVGALIAYAVLLSRLLRGGWTARQALAVIGGAAGVTVVGGVVAALM